MLCRILWIILIAIDFGILSVTTCPVYLGVWPKGKTSFESVIEVRWGPNCETVPDSIGVFEQDPSISDAPAKYSINTAGSASGEHVIEDRIGSFVLPGGWDRKVDTINRTAPKKYPNGKCLHYYVASFRDKDLLSVNCLKIQPNWMRLNEHIADIPLKDLFIPGSHASGAYYNITKITSPLILKYGHTQNFDVWTQLVFGIRYLDLSIGYRQAKNKKDLGSFWIVHENMFVTRLERVLDDIKLFAQVSEEVLLIDIGEFPLGFYKHPERHVILLSILEEKLGPITFRRPTESDPGQSYKMTVNDIVKAGKNLLITYPAKELHAADVSSDMVWPPWKRFSSSDMNSSQTLDFMRVLFGKKSASPIQGEGFVFYGIKGLDESYSAGRKTKLETTRERAVLINNKLTNWLSGAWSIGANVVATDFFMGTNLIEIAIYSNRHKAFNMLTNFTNFEIRI